MCWSSGREMEVHNYRTYGAPMVSCSIITQGHRFAVTLGYGYDAPMVLDE